MAKLANEIIIGIVGSRRRDEPKDFAVVCAKFLDILCDIDSENIITICSGLCPKGADSFAVVIAEHYEFNTLWFPAKWEEHGRAAGFIRNTDIAENSDILIACVTPGRKGGTEDCIRKFIKLHGSDNLYLV